MLSKTKQTMVVTKSKDNNKMRKLLLTNNDAKDLIFVYENMNILSNKTMREIIKPIIEKIIDSLDSKERNRILELIK